MRIVVLGFVVRGPLGGASWHFLQYVLGLKDLGHDVLFLEDSDNYNSCYNPDTYEMTIDPSYGINFIQSLFQSHGLKNNWAYYDEHTNSWFGLTQNEVFKFCYNADIVINIANMNPVREWWMNIPARILLDTDPAFTQLKHIEEKQYRGIADHHTHFFSFGENFGKTNCTMPDDGYDWKPTRQPVVISAWHTARPRPDARWTTVMLWDAYKVRHYKGITYGMKSASFDDYFDLPNLVNDPLELAIGSATAPKKKLQDYNWHLFDSSTIAKSPESFQQYLRQSKGEWSIAKHGYVVSNSGWFSERSTGYLATGRPVVVQDTGFSEVIECGKGLLAFKNLEEAIHCIEQINAGYAFHCKQAREIAKRFFDSRAVLSNMIKSL